MKWVPTDGYEAKLEDADRVYKLVVTRKARAGGLYGEPSRGEWRRAEIEHRPVERRQLDWREPALTCEATFGQLEELDLVLNNAVVELEASAAVWRKPIWSFSWPLRVFPWA